MISYAVAGVTGHVGSEVARALLDHGKRVRVIVRNAERGGEWSRRGAEVALGSLDDRGFLSAAIAGTSGFFTLLPGDPMAPDYPDAMFPMGDAIAGAVKSSGVPHVVMLSSVGAELPGGTGPIRTLHHLENALRGTGTVLTALRACSFQENIAEMIPAARNAGIYPNFMPSRGFAFPMIATRDIGRVAAMALMAPPAASEIVDLAGPSYSAADIAGKLSALLGKGLQIVDIPPAGQVAALRQAGLPERAAAILAELNAAIGAGILIPKGDRTVTGTTTIDEMLPGLLAARG